MAVDTPPDSLFFRVSIERKARRAVLALLIVALVVLLSALVERRPPQRTMTGTVAEFRAGDRITVGDMSMTFVLRQSTTFEGNPSGFSPGRRVQVWWRSVADRQPVAERVRVLPDPPPR
jgi:hypothetical protein